MPKNSPEFGNKIKYFLAEKGLTYRAASFASNISASYWKDMADGRVPSEDVIEKICAVYEDLDENELRNAAGYSFKTCDIDAVKAVELVMRSNDKIPEEGVQQILDFVKEMQIKYCGDSDGSK